MRRLLPWLLSALLAVGLAVFFGWPSPRSAPEATRPAPPATSLSAGPRPTALPELNSRAAVPSSSPSPPAEAPDRARLEAGARAVRQACGLPLQTRCEGSSCVVFAATPAMDGLAGWLQLTWSSPGFVGSVLARDAGVRALPCPEAIASLDLAAIRMLPTAEGEVWCSGTGPAHRELCERSTGVPGFTGETRLLRF